MKVRITFDLDRLDREAIANHYGEDPPAGYGSCKAAIESLVAADIEDMISDLQENQEAERQEREESS